MPFSSVEFVEGLFRKVQKPLPLFTDLGKATTTKGYNPANFKATVGTFSDYGTFEVRTTTLKSMNCNLQDGTLRGVDAERDGDGVIRHAMMITNKDKTYPNITTIKWTMALAPRKGFKSGGISQQFKNFSYHAATDGTKMETSALMRHGGWLTGAKVEYDRELRSVKNASYAIGRSFGSSLQTFLLCENWKDYTYNIYKQLGTRLGMGMQFGFGNGRDKKPFYNLGARYAINDLLTVRGKVNDEAIAGLGFELKFCFVEFAGYTHFDLKKLDLHQPRHQERVEGGDSEWGLKLKSNCK